jgi:hypothetical protein
MKFCCLMSDAKTKVISQCLIFKAFSISVDLKLYTMTALSTIYTNVLFIRIAPP